MFLQDYLWLGIETDNDSAICPHNLLFQGEASDGKGSRSVLWKECWIQLFMGVNDNVWCSVESLHVTASADPTEGSRWGVLMLFPREGKPLAVWSHCRQHYWDQYSDWGTVAAGSFGRSGQDFSGSPPPGFWASWSHNVLLWAAKAEFTINNLTQSPLNVMERITGLGKPRVRLKQKLGSRGDFPWSCKVPARPRPSEHSPFPLHQPGLIYRMLRLWFSPSWGSWKPGGISLQSVLTQLMENLSEVRPWGLFFGLRSEKERRCLNPDGLWDWEVRVP